MNVKLAGTASPVGDTRVGTLTMGPGSTLNINGTVPLTSTQRGLPHHVPVPANTRTGLDRDSYAMTEQIRALAYRRIERQLGAIDEAIIGEISHYLHLFIA